MATFRPTLFVGLGTTGAQILGYLQELIVQEYLEPEFPIFSLLSFITTGADGRYNRLAGKKNIHHLQVPDMTVIRADLANKTDDRAKALQAWFPNDLALKAGFEHGSGHIRAAGRLHFWRNYLLIRDKVHAAARSCTSPDSIAKATAKLRARLGADHPDIERDLNVYVVGTLSGGTCSGMATDFGYMVRSLAGFDQQIKQIIGAFTVLNAAQAEDQQFFRDSGGNCYTSLSEMNYCYHPSGKKTRIVLPDGINTLDPTAKLPYDYVYLLGPRTMDGDALINSVHQYDHEAVLQMAALNLFLDACTGTNAVKSGLREEYRKMVHTVGEPDAKGRCPRFLSSFGTAAISYPKYSLARAAAAILAMQVFAKWLNKEADQPVIDDRVKTTVLEFKERLLPMLGKRPDGPSLEEKIRAGCRVTGEILAMSSTAFRAAVSKLPEPKEDPFPAKFDGDFKRYVETQANETAKHLFGLVRTFVDDCRSDAKLGLPGILVALDRLEEGLKGCLSTDKTPDQTISIDPAALDPYFDSLKVLEGSPWLKFLFLRNQAVAEQKRSILRVYEARLMRRLRSLLVPWEQWLANAVSRSLIEEVRRGLNEKQIPKLRECYDPENPEAGHFTNIYLTILNRLRSPAKNMLYVFSNPDGDAKQEVDFLAAKINTDEAERIILERLTSGTGTSAENRRELDDFVAKIESPLDMAELILDHLAIDMLRVMGDFNVMEQVLKLGPATLQDLVKYSSPYIELDQFYFQNHRKVPPSGRGRNILFAPATNEADITRRLLPIVPKLRHQDIDWDPQTLSGLSHYLIFYCEEPLFSTTFMSAFPGYQRAYQQVTRAQLGDSAITWTDKRWARTDGPDLDQSNRLEYIRFILEHAWEVLCQSGADAKATKSLFRGEQQSAKSFILPPSKEHRTLEDYFTVGEESDYRRASERHVSMRFIPCLVDALKLHVRFLRDTPQASMDAFYDLCTKVRQSRRAAMQDERKHWSDEQRIAHELDDDKLNAFFVHTQQLAWDTEPDPEGALSLRKFPWLLDWTKENY